MQGDGWKPKQGKEVIIISSSYWGKLFGKYVHGMTYIPSLVCILTLSKTHLQITNLLPKPCQEEFSVLEEWKESEKQK